MLLLEGLFDQNATIKESDDEDLADLNAEMVRVEPATPPEEHPTPEVPVSHQRLYLSELISNISLNFVEQGSIEPGTDANANRHHSVNSYD